MAPKRKRPASRRSRTAKRERHMIYCLVGGVSPGLLIRIGKVGYGITKALGEHQTKESSKLRKNVDEKWNKANLKDMQANTVRKRGAMRTRT